MPSVNAEYGRSMWLGDEPSSTMGDGVGSRRVFNRESASYAPRQNLLIRGEQPVGAVTFVNIASGYVFHSSVALGYCRISRNGPILRLGQHCSTTVKRPRVRYIQSRRIIGSGRFMHVCESLQFRTRREDNAKTTRSIDPAKTSLQFESESVESWSLNPWRPH